MSFPDERVHIMFESIKAEIGLLLTEMETQPENATEIYEKVREKLNELRATGMPVPDDLADMEKRLERELFGRNG